MPSMMSSRPEWRGRSLDADEGYEISPQEVFSVTVPSALRYADIIFAVSYRPWVLQVGPYTKEFRFFTQRLDNGGIEWHQKPLDED